MKYEIPTEIKNLKVFRFIEGSRDERAIKSLKKSYYFCN